MGEDLGVGLHHVKLVAQVRAGEEGLDCCVFSLTMPVQCVRVGQHTDLEPVRQIGDQLLYPFEETLRPIRKTPDHLFAVKGQTEFVDDAFTERFGCASASLEVANGRAAKPTGPELLRAPRIITENLGERTQLDEHPTHVEHHGAVALVLICHRMHASGPARRQAGQMSHRPSRRTCSTALGLVLLVAACSGGEADRWALTAEAVTLAALPDGGFIWADIDGGVHDEEGNEIAAVDVVTDGQRGLLGLTVDSQGRVFVAYTDATFALVVSELADGERLIWRGPTTVQGGNGGRMIIRDGELIIGIGLLNDRVGQADPSSIVGKLIAIDPDGTPDTQRPRILSGPWNNPFAFDTTPDGSIWVADNHPQDGEERLARGDQGSGPEVALVLPADSAPSGLAATAEALFICGYNSLQLDRYDLIGGTPVFAKTVADDCVLDVAVLADDDLIYSTGTSIVRLTP